MSRIKSLFQQKNKRVLNMYCTAGFPTLNSTVEIIQALENGGADLVELGMPYSDPLADGPVIQRSSTIAISNGMTIAVLLEQLKVLRPQISIPVILMGYMNPVLQYGFEKFCADAAGVGVDGLILPDLPAFEFETQYADILKKYGLDFIFLITPETSPERVHQLDALSDGFLYAVSASATTGSATDEAAIEEYLKRIQSYGLKNPVLVGFGIKDKQSFDMANKYANGAIIGSAYIKAIENASNLSDTTNLFLKDVLGEQQT